MIARMQFGGCRIGCYHIVALGAFAFVCGCSGRNDILSIPAAIDGGDELEPLLLSEIATNLARRAVFQIPNSRQAPMTVELVKKSCGCEKLDLPEKPVS